MVFRILSALTSTSIVSSSIFHHSRSISAYLLVRRCNATDVGHIVRFARNAKAVPRFCGQWGRAPLLHLLDEGIALIEIAYILALAAPVSDRAHDRIRFAGAMRWMTCTAVLAERLQVGAGVGRKRTRYENGQNQREVHFGTGVRTMLH